jgi:glyoxylase-like metal-dependent hydrolase (beta-lactamase superfamily II)
VLVLRPAPKVLAFYDGRVEGYRFSPEPNWVDQGALELGIASYAIVDGTDALVYDTHVSVEHAERVRRELEAEGAERFVVVLSHWHLDHIAGTAAFADSEVIAGERTAELMERHRAAIEAGTHEGPPRIDPLVMPTRTFAGRERLLVGETEVELIGVDIHSDDATVLWLADRRLLFAGDTLEDTVTYVTEPDRLTTHLGDLSRLRELGPERIFPNHGDPDVIASGGYPPELIDATAEYLELLRRSASEPALGEQTLRELLAGPIEAGSIRYYAPYEQVHSENVESVRAATRT